MGKTFFTADTHFFHHNIIKFSNRPYQTVWEMNEGLIDNWNKKVAINDTIYHLGDVTWKNPEEILPRLNGKIILIKGNHDHKIEKLKRNGIREVHDYLEIKLHSKILVLFHYPIENWNRKHYGTIHLHGHCHGELKNKIQNRMDIGVDCHDMQPVEFEELLEKVKVYNEHL